MMVNQDCQNNTKSVEHEKSLLLGVVLSGLSLLFLLISFVLTQTASPLHVSKELYYWTGLTLTTPMLYFCLVPWYVQGGQAYSSRFTIDIPIAFSLCFCFAYSAYSTLLFTNRSLAYFDSIILIVFMLLSCRYLVLFCKNRVQQCIKGISTPPVLTANKRDSGGKSHRVTYEDIHLNDILVISPGEVFPVDGTILEGETSVDESMLTGEAHAVPKFTDDVINAGTRNLDKGVTIEATSVFRTSTFGKILTSLENVRIDKDHSEHEDNDAPWYPLISATLAMGVFCWWLPNSLHQAIFSAMLVLFVTCPFLFALSHAATTTSVLEICSQNGILIKHLPALFKLSQARHIIFDKTGTLTEGHLMVESIEYFAHKAHEVLPLIATIEKNTHHPIAHAIVEYAKAQEYPYLNVDVHRLTVFPGKGIRAMIEGKSVLIGSAKWLRKNGVFIPLDIIAQQDNIKNAQTVFVHCAIKGIEVARIQLRDKLRQNAGKLVHFLKEKHLEISMLSGDRPAIVDAIAKQLGPIATTACALPRQKEAQIAFLQDQGHITAMVGDGLNDALALKRADIGIALGCGNAISLLCADIILHTPQLSHIEACYRISDMAKRILRQNTLIALTFSAIMLPFAAIQHIHPNTVLMLCSVSAVIILANTARLKYVLPNTKKKRSPKSTPAFSPL